MSQVVVTDDKLKSRRDQSAKKELQIDREGQFAKWRMSDITKFDPIAAAIGIALLPVFFSWYLIGLLIKVAVYVGAGCSKLIGLLIGTSKNI
jgi:hypothetical protein